MGTLGSFRKSVILDIFEVFFWFSGSEVLKIHCHLGRKLGAEVEFDFLVLHMAAFPLKPKPDIAARACHCSVFLVIVFEGLHIE